MFALDVAMFGEVGNEFVVGYAASLGQTIHAFVDFDVDVSVVDKGAKIVLIEDGLGN